MPTRKTCKYRLYPTQAQEQTLLWVLQRCQELYNAALQERRDAYRMQKRSVSCYDQINQLPSIKAERPEYLQIGSHVLQDVLRRLDKAMQAFFRRVKQGNKPGFPRFKNTQQYDSFTYPDVAGWSLTDTHLCLAKIGDVRLRLHRPIEGTIKTVTIRRDVDQWYVCFSCEVPDDPPLPPCEKAIGLDLGVRRFATLSTGEEMHNPRHYRKGLKQIKRLSQVKDRRKQGSHRRKRAALALAKAHRKVRNQRATFHHQLARALVNRYGVIVMEDLKIANLTKTPEPKPDPDHAGAYLPNGAAAKAGLNQSIFDAGWGQFQSLCIVKAERAGRRVVLVDPRYTSQLCSGCRQIVKKDLSERWHSCKCGCSLDRDHNAALNILFRGQEVAHRATAL